MFEKVEGSEFLKKSMMRTLKISGKRPSVWMIDQPR